MPLQDAGVSQSAVSTVGGVHIAGTNTRLGDDQVGDSHISDDRAGDSGVFERLLSVSTLGSATPGRAAATDIVSGVHIAGMNASTRR
jgi:hypothetical protein